MFKLLNTVYTKTKTNPEAITDSDLIVINRFLSLYKNNLYYLKIVIRYMFYIKPINYFYLLYFIIPKQYKAPYLKNIKKVKIKKEKKYDEVQELLEWSDRELEYHRYILDKLFLLDRIRN